MPFLAKFLLFIFGFAVFAAIGAWIMGGESTKHSTSITVDASPDTVFGYLIDGEKVKQWGSDVVSAGTFSEGSTNQERVTRGEKGDVVWTDSLMRFQSGDDGKALSIQSRNGGLTRTYVFQLEENEIGGTNVLYRLTRSAGGLDRFLFSFQEDDSDTRMAEEMTRLKSLIESEVDPSDMKTPDASGEDEVPLVALSGNGNNEPEAISKSGDGSLKDEVVGPTVPEPEKKLPLSERKFESLFGTGRPK